MRSLIAVYAIVLLNSVCFCQESKKTEAQILQAQKQILEKITSGRNEADYYIKQYIKEGYSKDVFDINLINESVARSVLSEIKDKDKRSRSSILYIILLQQIVSRSLVLFLKIWSM